MSSLPKPGIYFDIAFDEYLSWDAVSNSRLSKAKQSMAHYDANTQMAETKPLRFGSLVHCGQLEPLALAQRYAVMPRYELDQDNKTQAGVQTTSKNTTYFKSKVAAFQETLGDKELIEQHEFEEMVGLVNELAKNNKRRKAFYEGDRGVWLLPADGVLSMGIINSR